VPREKRVLILDGSIWPEIYRPVDHWRALLGSVSADAVHVSFGDKVPSLGRYSHLVVTGSETSITKHEPWYDAEVEAIREAFRRGMSILGSCFGHQMLAVALSGKEHAAASSTPEVGWIEVEVTEEDELLAGLPRPLHVFAAHFDEVRDLARPWRVLARSDRCAVEAARYGERPIWGLQAHPEISPQDARILLEGELVHFPNKAQLIHQVLSQVPRDHGVAREIVRRFLASPPQETRSGRGPVSFLAR